jgi:hypothetical protein
MAPQVVNLATTVDSVPVSAMQDGIEDVLPIFLPLDPDRVLE